MTKLLQQKGALPYLAIVFINAFVDLGHKITIQNTLFKVYDGNEQIIFTAIVNGLILLPFILLFIPAGLASDRYTKNQVIRTSAWVAVGLTAAITAFYHAGWFWAAFAMTFLLAVQSAFYSPAKFSYIKLMFGKSGLAQANGLVQATTIIAILLGTFGFSIAFEAFYQSAFTSPDQVVKAIAPIGWLLVINSVIELILAYRLPELEDPKGERPKQTTKIRNTLKPISSNSVIFLSIVGLSVFWSVGQVMLAAFPSFAKESLNMNNTIMIQGILAASGIGIAIGSAIAGKVSKGYIELGLIPIGAVGMASGLATVTYWSSGTAHILNYLFIGTMGGLFIVPLNALIQFNAKNQEIGKVLAGKNLIQNIAMLVFLLITIGFALLGLSSSNLLNLIAVVAALGGLYTITKLPQSMIRLSITFVLTRRYKVNVEGIKNIPEQGGVLLLGNHISWLDWAMIQIACPRPVRFVMAKDIYDLWYVRWVFDLFGVIPIQSGPNSRDAIERISDSLNNGDVVCLFPEGTISRTGHLAEFRKGYERACAECNDEVVIVPFYLRGLWGSQFSRASDQFKQLRKQRLFRDVVIGFGKEVRKDTKADVLKRNVFDLSIQTWNSYIEKQANIPTAWINTVKRDSGKMAIADSQGTPLTASKALAGSLAIAKRIRANSQEKNIGLLLPTSSAAAITNMAGLIANKTLVNLNYTASQSALEAAVEQAEIKTIYTAKRFINTLSSKGIDLSPILENKHVIYLEDLANTISTQEKTLTWLGVKCLPAFAIKMLFKVPNNINDTAAILFSSGSEGAPKGVMLSHQNIMANLKQTADVLNMEDNDVIMASLPFFHAFGLTATQFLPLIEGIPMVCHPDPTDALATAKAVAKYRATIMCGTSTFLRLYTRNNKVHPLMLDSLRVVIAGAEKLRPEVSEAFQLKFNKPVLEGYGVTETAPIASCNLPDRLDTRFWKVQRGQKVGTVGMPLPGSSFKIVDPETWEELSTGEAGMILIGGLQVMQGYLNNPEKTDQVITEENGIRWYTTGDKGKLDEDGFLTILDRYSRFAKLGGEMVSLSTVEAAVTAIVADETCEVCAVNLPDSKKGEKIILLSTHELNSQDMKKQLLEHGCNPLAVPAEWFTIEAVPKLGSGKTNFAEAKNMALALTEGN